MKSLAGRTVVSVLACGAAFACSPLTPGVPVPVTIEAGTINFGNLTSNGAALSEYREHGFTMKFSGASWTEALTYGNFQPAAIFRIGARASVTGTVEISGNGQLFSFYAVDLYSSVTTIPHRIVGLRAGNVVFTLDDQLPMTLGQFKTVQSPSYAPIDTLRISVTNNLTSDLTPCCSNPVGLDNILLR